MRHSIRSCTCHLIDQRRWLSHAFSDAKHFLGLVYQTLKRDITSQFDLPKLYTIPQQKLIRSDSHHLSRDGSRSAMDSEAYVSASRTPKFTRRHHHPVLPPWEVRSMAQIPFLQPGSPSLAQRNEQSFFTARSTSHATRRPRLNTMDSAESDSEYSYPVDEQIVLYPQ
jgi:hypothetical protein